MADTSVQIECEDWVRKEWMPIAFGQKFHRERLKLSAGGVFDFDAISADESIVATISTSMSLTASGKHAVGKLMKLRSDMLFLLMAPATRRVVVLTDLGMYERCMKERTNGRVPPEIEFAHATLPPPLAGRLVDAQKRASDEVTPS